MDSSIKVMVVKTMFFMLQYATIIVPLFVGLFAACFFLYLYPILDDKIASKTGGYLDWMVVHLDRMFMKTSRRKCFLILLFSTLTVGLAGFVSTLGSGFFNFVITVSTFYLGWSAPRLVITILWKRRLRKFDAQLVDALDLMSNSLKSGLNLLQIIQVVVRELPDPLSQEFQLVLNQQHLGVSLDEALTNVTERVPTEDLIMVINAVLILRETGGNLSETFDIIATTIRERRKVEGKIKAVTAQGVTQSTILLLMPFGIALTLMAINPEFLRPLISNKWGYLLISTMLALQVVGGVWLKKLVKIDV